MSKWLDSLHPALKPLWDLENELRRAAQNAIFMRSEEAKHHLAEAQRHYGEALNAIRGTVPPQDPPAVPGEPPQPPVKTPGPTA
jgi:hypothetical protein